MLFALVTQVVVIGLACVLVPVLSRRTTPLGVSVPSDHVRDPQVRGPVFAYQVVTAVLTALVLLASAAALLRHTTAPEWPFALAPLFVVVGSGAAYVWQRRRIVAAKEAGGWYAGRSVGISARITRDDGEAAPAASPPLWPLGIGLVWLISTIAYGAAIYASIPDPYPAHTDFAGNPTRWVDKNPFEVFAGCAIGVGILILLGALAWWLPRRPRRGLPDGDAASAAARDAVHLRMTETILVWIGPPLGVGIGVLDLLAWHGRWGTPTAIATAGMLAAVMVAVAVPVLRATRPLREIDAGARPGADIESPDDDRHWWLGLFYVNREDPALLVPKRAGVGLTLNVGRPAAQVLLAAMLGGLVWALVAAL